VDVDVIGGEGRLSGVAALGRVRRGSAFLTAWQAVTREQEATGSNATLRIEDFVAPATPDGWTALDDALVILGRSDPGNNQRPPSGSNALLGMDAAASGGEPAVCVEVEIRFIVLPFAGESPGQGSMRIVTAAARTLGGLAVGVDSESNNGIAGYGLGVRPASVMVPLGTSPADLSIETCTSLSVLTRPIGTTAMASTEIGIVDVDAPLDQAGILDAAAAGGIDPSSLEASLLLGVFPGRDETDKGWGTHAATGSALAVTAIEGPRFRITVPARPISGNAAVLACKAHRVDPGDTQGTQDVT